MNANDAKARVPNDATQTDDGGDDDEDGEESDGFAHCRARDDASEMPESDQAGH